MRSEIAIDFWNILFFAISSIGFFISVALFLKRGPMKIPFILIGSYTLIHSYQIFEYNLIWTNLMYYLPQFNNLYFPFEFLTGPLLYLFFRTLFGYKSLAVKDLLHLIPFAIVLFSKMPFYLMSPSEKYAFFTSGSGTYFNYSSFLIWLDNIQMLVYFFLLYKFVSKHDAIGKIRVFCNVHMYLYLMIIISNIVYFALVWKINYSKYFDYNISIFLAGSILFSGWFALVSPAIMNGSTILESLFSIDSYTTKYTSSTIDRYMDTPLDNTEIKSGKAIPIKAELETSAPEKVSTIENQAEIKTEITVNIKYKNSGLTTSAAIELKVMLENHMQSTKDYRENDIALDKLAVKLNTSRHNLSQVINEQYKLNFFDYINMLRITEAKELLSNPKSAKMQVIEIAYKVGYNNKVTFNNAFKKFTGTIPTKYREQFLK